MCYLRLIFLVFLFIQSVLFAQADSTKKKFKPSGLIDAAPVAIDKADFSPTINITIQAVDATSKQPLEARIAYYISGDSLVTIKNGKEVSISAKSGQEIVIVSNVARYIWQTQIINTSQSDTAYTLRFKKIKRDEEIIIHSVNLNSQNDVAESLLYGHILGIMEFLKLNSTVKICLYACPGDGKENVFSNLFENCDKKRFHVKNCLNRTQKIMEIFTVKITDN